MDTAHDPHAPSATALPNAALPNPSSARARILARGSRVVAVADTTGVTRYLPPARFTDPPEGRVGVLARPGMRRPGWLAADVLLALGCRDDVTGGGRAGEADWTLVNVWLKTHAITHLYIQHAWTLPLPVLETLLGLLRHLDCVLWLVGDTPLTTPQLELIADWTSGETITGEEFTAAWADLPSAVPTDVTATREAASSVHLGPATAALSWSAWPTHLPDDDFATFRAACRDLLTPDEFTLVDAAFRRHVAALRPKVASLGLRADLNEETVAALLSQEWERSRTMAHFITFVRAAQVAFFLADHYLQVDLDQLVGTAATMPRRALRSAATWARLHAYPEPHRGAICALAGAGVAVEDMRQLVLGSVDAATGAVTRGPGRHVEVEPAARIFLTAQRYLRVLQGADVADALLPTRDGRTPLSASALVTVINTARRELGVAVAPARQDRKGTGGDRWTTRWGVCLQELL